MGKKVLKKNKVTYNLSPKSNQWISQYKKGLVESNSFKTSEEWAAKKFSSHHAGSFTRQSYLYGRFVDFYFKKKAIVVEIDGDCHNDTGQKDFDSESDKWFRYRYAIRVFRVKNYDEKRLMEIIKIIKQSPRGLGCRKKRAKFWGIPLQKNYPRPRRKEFLAVRESELEKEFRIKMEDPNA